MGVRIHVRNNNIIMSKVYVTLCSLCAGRKICRNFWSPGMRTRTQQSMNDILQEGKLDVKNLKEIERGECKRSASQSC